MNKIFILIPTHNRKELLKKCLLSIEQQSYKQFQTVVVDDGSTDGTSEMIKQNFPNTTILKGNGNLWWTGAVRKAVEYVKSKSKNGDFILLMNDDTTFDSQYFGIIVQVSKKNHRAIVGSTCFELDKKTIVESGVKMDWKKGGVIRLSYPKNPVKLKATNNINTMCGRGALVPIEVIKKIGNFTSWLPHYGADYEYFLRAKNKGFLLLLSYEAKLYRSSTPGGIKFTQKKISIKEWVQILFSKRSRSNIIALFHLIRLTCPPKYRIKNYKGLILRFLDVSSYTLPVFIRNTLLQTKRDIWKS